MLKQSSNFFSPIRVELALFTLTALGMGLAIQKEGVTTSNEHLWWQNGTQVFISFMKLFSDAYKVYRDQTRQEEGETEVQMKTLHAAGQQALRQGEYRYAVDCFKRSARMFKSYYKAMEPEDSYAQCIYMQALSLYKLRAYQEARTLIEALFKERPKLEVTIIKIELHNLYGLLCFIQYQSLLFEQEKPDHTLLEIAREQLQQSYMLKPEQDDVYLMLHYLQGNMALVVERQPFQILTQLRKTDVMLPLSLQPEASRFYPLLYFIVADAHADQGKWTEAIYLYEQYLESVPSGTSPDALFDQFIMRFYCLVAYRQYLAAFPRDEATYELLEHITVPLVQQGMEQQQTTPQQDVQEGEKRQAVSQQEAQEEEQNRTAPQQQAQEGEQKQAPSQHQQVMWVFKQHPKAEMKKRATLMALRAKFFLDTRVPGALPAAYERAYACLAHEAQQVVDAETYKRFSAPAQPAARSIDSLWSERFFVKASPAVSGESSAQRSPALPHPHH